MSTMTLAGGAPNYSNRTISGEAAASRFIPEVWSSKLNVKFYDATVLSAISNTDYEGEISNYGDKVYIRTVPDITIRPYVKGGNLTYENPESPNKELLIDQGKYFAFTADDVDLMQSDLKLLDSWSTDASEQLKIAVDTDILNDIPGDAAAANRGNSAGRVSEEFDLGVTGSPIAIESENILDFIVDLGTVLDEQSVPESNRWLVAPAWFCGKIKKSDLKDASLAGDGTSIMRNGRLGVVDRFTIYHSNNLAPITDGSNTCFNVLAGHPTALTFASQMTKMETLRNPQQFGDLVRGLHVYGYEVIKAEAMAVGYVRKG